LPVQITIGPRSAGEAAGLADSWVKRIRGALAEQHPRFEVMTHAWLDRPPGRVWRCLRLGPGGYPLYEIILDWQAAQPEVLSVELKPVESSVSAPLKKSFKWLGAAVTVGLVGWWLYFAFFETNWGRVFDVLTFERTTKADRGHAFSALVGWGVSIMIGYIIAWTGEWLDEKIDWLVRPGRQRYIDNELGPWLEKFIAETAGAPVPGWPNVMYAASGDMRPAPGYTWASDDPNSREVRPVRIT
jgi:hypothetical protein